MGRKRQRSRAALLTDDDDKYTTAPIDESDDRGGSMSQPDDEVGEETEEPEDESLVSEERKMEQDVWDAFKEEHHEVLEQLPLSLHRQFKLMRELDSHGEAFHADLLTSIRRYIYLRENLAMRQAQNDNVLGTRLNGMDVASGGDTSPTNAMQIDAAEEATHADATVVVDGQPQAGNANANPLGVDQPKLRETTRKILQHIAQTSEEAIRTAEEKVNIAQTAYETVDRHIRLLDQAIKEQEAAISLGVRPGTHLAPILLPDLVVPRWARPPRVEHSPVPSLSPEPELYVVEEPPVLELPPPQVVPPKASKKGKKAAVPKPSKPEKEEGPPVVVPVASEEAVGATRARRTGVRLTIPAQPVPPALSVPADPNEDRFCYCNQVSFGTMIGCDNEGGCKLEWFHLGCTGLLEVPSKKTKWYCRECKPKMMPKGRSRA